VLLNFTPASLSCRSGLLCLTYIHSALWIGRFKRCPCKAPEDQVQSKKLHWYNPCPRSLTRTSFETPCTFSLLWRSTFVTNIRMQKILVILWLYWNPITLVFIWKVLRQAFRRFNYFRNPSTVSSITFWNFLKILSVFKVFKNQSIYLIVLVDFFVITKASIVSPPDHV
jgi:hypothetical protein